MDVLPSPSAVPIFRRVALAASMFLTTAAVGFLQPFLPLYLEASGLGRGQIGIVTGMGPALALLVQPLLGRLSDRLDARRPLMMAAALVAGFAYLAYRHAGTPLDFALLTAVGANGFTYLNAVGGVLVGRMVADRAGGGAAYSGYRVWGSVGYIVVALWMGWLVSRGLGPRSGMGRAELDVVFTYGPLIFFAIALVALFVPDAPRSPLTPRPPLPLRGEGESVPPAAAASHEAESSSSSPSPLSGRGGRGVRGVGNDTNLNRFLLAYFLYQFALYGASAYISLYLKSLHATPLFITGTFAAGVVCEVLVMTRVGRLTDLYGRRPALALAFLLMPIRLLLYIPATGPLWVLMVQTLHGLNFGIIGTIAIVFVNDGATDRDRGVRQARLAGTSGLAIALGPFACGGIAERWGMDAMFAAMALVGAAGAFVFLTQVRESHASPESLTGRGPALLRPFLRLLASSPGAGSPGQ